MIEQELSKLEAKPLRSRQDANALREGAESYLSLREIMIATSGRKLGWDMMFQVLVLRHLADFLANSVSILLARVRIVLRRL